MFENLGKILEEKRVDPGSERLKCSCISVQFVEKGQIEPVNIKTGDAYVEMQEGYLKGPRIYILRGRGEGEGKRRGREGKGREREGKERGRRNKVPW